MKQSSDPPEKAFVSLTFDDGPDPVWTPLVLDALSRKGVTATFFVVAPLATKHPHLVERMVSEGHEVAFHCYRHVRHTESSEIEIRSDVRYGLRDLASLDIEPQSWRPPWGVVTDGTERVAGEFGLRLTLWTEDTHDWRGDSSEEMLQNIEGGLRSGSVVLMHDGIGPGATRSDCKETLDLVPVLIEALEQRGLHPTTVSALSNEVLDEEVKVR